MKIHQTLIAALLITCASQLAARSQDCTNFWINPDTGQEECLQPGTKLQTTSGEPATATPKSGPVLKFYNVEAGQGYVAGEIHNASDRAFELTRVRYRLEARGEILSEGILWGNKVVLEPGESTNFREPFSPRLNRTPRGTGVVLILQMPDGEIGLKPRYNYRLN